MSGIALDGGCLWFDEHPLWRSSASQRSAKIIPHALPPNAGYKGDPVLGVRLVRSPSRRRWSARGQRVEVVCFDPVGDVLRWIVPPGAYQPAFFRTAGDGS